MSFLQKDYKVPISNANYSKFQQGENNFRVLSSAVVGYEYWNNDNKPVRQREIVTKKPADIRLEKDNTWKIKHFWAFVVWNYDTNQIQIMEITQKGIMNDIKALVDNDKWGNPIEYDLTITRTGEGLETKYTVMPNPKTKLQKEIADEFGSKTVNLDNLYTGDDPFGELSEEAEVLNAVEDL